MPTMPSRISSPSESTDQGTSAPESERASLRQKNPRRHSALAFEIDNSALRRESPRPRHLKARFSSGRSSASSSSSTLPLPPAVSASSSPSTSTSPTSTSPREGGVVAGKSSAAHSHYLRRNSNSNSSSHHQHHHQQGNTARRSSENDANSRYNNIRRSKSARQRNNNVAINSESEEDESEDYDEENDLVRNLSYASLEESNTDHEDTFADADDDASMGDTDDEATQLALEDIERQANIVAAKRAALLESRSRALAARRERFKQRRENAERMRQREANALRESLDMAMNDAQDKREKYVMSRGQIGAARVAKVREVAMDTQIRRISERHARRRAIEDKLRSSSWRRLQMSKISRSKLMSLGSVTEAIRMHAALAIQARWRLAKLRPWLARFSKLMLRVPMLRAMPFAAAAARLQAKPTIIATQRLLRRLLRSAIEPPPFANGNATSARVFLTHYMILAHTEALVENPNDPLETELMNTATTLYNTTNALLQYATLSTNNNDTSVDEKRRQNASEQDTASSKSPDRIKRENETDEIEFNSGEQPSLSGLYNAITAFLQAWFAFHVTFEAFKAKDTQGVVNNLIQNGLELARMLVTVAARGGSVVDSEYRPSIEAQLRVTRRRLQCVGGNDAIQQFEAELAKEDLAELIPGVTGPALMSSGSQDSMENNTDALPLAETTSSSVAELLAPAQVPTMEQNHAALIAAERWASMRTQQQQTAGPRDSVLTSSPSQRLTIRTPTQSVNNNQPPTSPVTNSGGARARPRISGPTWFAQQDASLRGIFENHALAHEVVLDPLFTLKPNQVVIQARDAGLRALRDRFAELENAGDFSFVPPLVKEIRETLSSLVLDQQFQTRLQTELDDEHVARQITHGAFEFPGFLHTLVALMLKIAAPARDQAINGLLALTKVSDVAAQLFLILNDMKLDLANHYLHLLRPVLQSRIVGYEQTKFEEYLRSYPGAEHLFASGSEQLDVAWWRHPGLSRTVSWLQYATEELTRDLGARVRPVPGTTGPLKFEDVFREAMLNLISSGRAATTDNVPETLVLDVSRLRAMQDKLQGITVTASLVLIARATMGLPGPQDQVDARIADSLFQALQQDSVTQASIASELVAASGLDPSNQALADSALAMVTRVVGGKRDPVYAIVSRRVLTALRHWLAAGGPPAPASLAAHGLAPVRTALNELGRQLLVLAQHNKAVYATWYDSILDYAIKNVDTMVESGALEN